MAPPCVLPLLLIVLAPLVLPIDGRSAVKKRSVMGAGATWPDEVYTTWMAAYKVCQRMRGWGLGVVPARERKIGLNSLKMKRKTIVERPGANRESLVEGDADPYPQKPITKALT